MVRLPSFFEIELGAPLSFCFAWLTDYQETDKAINPALTSRKVVERSPTVVKLQDESTGPPLNKRRVTVHLHAPDSWEAQGEGTIYDYDLHYHLEPTARATRLTISGTVVTKPLCPFKTREENHARFVKGWGNYKRALEADFKASGAK